MEKNPETKPEMDVRQATHPWYLELIIEAVLVLFCAAIGALFIGLKVFPAGEDDLLTVTYSANKSFTLSKSLSLTSLVTGPLSILLVILLLCLFRPSGLKPEIGKNGKFLICLIILSLFGEMAYVLIADFTYGLLPTHEIFSILLAGVLTNIYEVLIYKLYLEGRTYSNKLFWELFRFAIVGLVAAVFDFLTCYLVQFILFKDNTAGYVTIIATACGFTIGVILNYLMSTYMVYKASHSGFSKTLKGKLLFLGLAIGGLLIGMGLQYLTYDVLFLKQSITFFSYPVDFVIRTLIVMVYNYVSRKLLIYRH
jgi:putative flippase GtrA